MLIGCSKVSSLVIELTENEKNHFISTLGKGPYLANMKQPEINKYIIKIFNKGEKASGKTRGSTICYVPSKGKNNTKPVIIIGFKSHKFIDIVYPNFFKRTKTTTVRFCSDENAFICTLNIDEVQIRENVLLEDPTNNGYIFSGDTFENISEDINQKVEDKKVNNIPEKITSNNTPKNIDNTLINTSELQKAINFINDTKKNLGDSFVLEINNEGLLRALREYI